MLDHQEILPIIRRFEENELAYSLGGSGMLYYPFSYLYLML